MNFLALVFFTSAAAIALTFAISRAWLKARRKKHAVAFFHPYTNDGGGGERVLWCAVRSIQKSSSRADCFIYSGDDISAENLRERALKRFGVRLLRPVQVVNLKKRIWIESSTYPRFTLIGQSLGSIVLACEALAKFTPTLFIDTSGYAFTYPVAFLFGCRVACYTHYPTISCDMISRVKQRKSLYNNSGLIANSGLLSFGKLVYYKIFACIYGLCGNFASTIMVNSSWTQNHILRLWGCPKRIFKIYPPCNVEALKAFPLERNFESNFYIVSLAQFRPEKAHFLQLVAFSMALKKLSTMEFHNKENEGETSEKDKRSQKASETLRLKFVGSCRHERDNKIVHDLKSLSAQLGISSRVDFLVNVSYDELKCLLGNAFCGMHSMTDEHFGISIVEYMAAGVIPIAHDSGGPKQDIVTTFDGSRIGFLATTEEEYADSIVHLIQMSETQRLQMAEAARLSVDRFSDDEFATSFAHAISPLLIYV